MIRFNQGLAGVLGAAVVGALLFSGCGDSSMSVGEGATPPPPASAKDQKQQKDAESKIEKALKNPAKKPH